MLKIEVMKTDGRELVKYTGTRDELLDSGVAEPRMLPCEGYMRRFRPQPEIWNSPGYFQTARCGDEFVITRWLHWQIDPARRARLWALLEPNPADHRAKRTMAQVISLDAARRRSTD